MLQFIGFANWLIGYLNLQFIPAAYSPVRNRKSGLSSAFIMLSSSAQLSAAFSVLPVAFTHFTQTFFQHNKQTPNELLSPDSSGSGWENIPSWPKINKRRGVAIRMSSCTFFEKYIV